MTLRTPLVVLALTLSPALAGAENYMGMLKPPQASLGPAGLYSFASIAPGAAAALAPTLENGYRLKLGYKYSRFLAVEGEYVDFGRSPASLFASPATLSSAFRSTGFGVDTVATLPLWRFSFYGRMGAWRGDARTGFGAYSTTLLSEPTRGTRWRYGLGMRYDFTPALGIRADLERYTPLGTPFASEAETADQISLGVSWRF